MKSDQSIRNICIASIKRKAAEPFDFLLTRVFEIETFPEICNDTFKLSDVHENELPISQTVVDKNTWTLITTRQIMSCLDGITKTTEAGKVNSWDWNDFKGYRKTTYTVGELLLDDQQKFEVFIETGKASMVAIYAIMTLVRQLKN
jgi:hypothetical protein